jgi:hypothetical protein
MTVMCVYSPDENVNDKTAQHLNPCVHSKHCFTVIREQCFLSTLPADNAQLSDENNAVTIGYAECWQFIKSHIFLHLR